MGQNHVIVGVAAVALAAVAGVWFRAAPEAMDGGADIAQGARLYGEACAACHGPDLEGRPDWQIVGPDGIFPAPPHDGNGHTWHHSDAVLFAYVKLGGAQALAEGAGVGQSSVERTFTGHDADLATGLVDMKFRQYDPDLGMFLSPDPLRGDAFDPTSLNPYMYAHNQPTKWVDPWGLQDSGSGDAGTSSETWNFPPTLICAGGCLTAEAWSEVGEISDAEGRSGSEPNTVSDTESSAVDWFIDAAAGTTCAASPHCQVYNAADDFYTDARWYDHSHYQLVELLDRIGIEDAEAKVDAAVAARDASYA